MNPLESIPFSIRRINLELLAKSLLCPPKTKLKSQKAIFSSRAMISDQYKRTYCCAQFLFLHSIAACAHFSLAHSSVRLTTSC
mmetsp:Transcript_40360/g.65002  ORF Transcript_40360/g.65002 Transcript_40360/m.65002 type:complete len:83 (-) Transcript_40360:1896-2144(-)